MASGKNKMRRTVFTTHLGRNVVVSTGKKPSSEKAVKFSSESELRKLAVGWPGARLVEIWNQLPGVKPIVRFTNRETAISRIWAAVHKPALSIKLGDGPTSTSKAERIIALLKGPSGATLRTIMDLTGWQSHSVRGFISAQLGKRMGFKVQSFKRDGERVYRIRS